MTFCNSFKKPALKQLNRNPNRCRQERTRESLQWSIAFHQKPRLPRHGRTMDGTKCRRLWGRVIWQQSWQISIPRSLHPIILDKRRCARRHDHDFAQYNCRPHKRNRLSSGRSGEIADSRSSCRSLLDEPLHKRRRGHGFTHYTGKPHVLSTSVVDLLDFFKCFPGLKWTIGSRLLRYYNPATAHSLPAAGKELRTRNSMMMELLSPSAATTTLMQLWADMESMKLSYGEKRMRVDDSDTLTGQERMQEC